MAFLCDACGTKYSRDDGTANLHVSPPRVDFRAFALAGQPPPAYAEHLTIDVCRACTTKILEFLGLPTTSCELPVPPAPPEDPVHEPAPGLSADDLRKLRDQGSLSDDDLRSLGIEPHAT